MKFSHILGIDISKKTFDVALIENFPNANVFQHQFSNNLTGYKELCSWLKTQKVKPSELLTCMENTGVYHRGLVAFLKSKEVFTWVENPVEIKWSMGLQRGKSDAIDAQRIAIYAFRNQDKAKPFGKMDKALQNIADLLTTRQRLITAKKMLMAPIKELKDIGLKNDAALIEKACKKSISTLEEEKEIVEKELEAAIQEDAKLKVNFNIVRSVRCVGLVASLQLIVYTHNFERFDNAKQLACYSGVAPFGYSSGTSIKGKNKVHKMANKTLKTALHMCAISSVRHNAEMKQYMERKVAEGKNKMSILNAIRNKIVHRVFACVRDQREYQMILA